MSKEETVEVSLKIPKQFMEFLEAVQKFTRVETTIEEWCYNQIVFGIRDMLQGNEDLAEFFKGFNGPELAKAYKLDKVFDC